MSDQTHRSVRERFGTYAANYVDSPVHSMGYSLDRLIELVAPAPNKLALDVATGGGHVARALAKGGADIVASDLTPPMLRTARGFLTGEAVQARYLCNDAQRLPFADNCFDIVACRFSAHHFPNPAEWVRESARIVKPGGTVGLMDHISPPDNEAARYCNAFQKLRDPSHVRELSAPEWQGIFEEAGLEVRHIETFTSRLDFPWWTKQQNNDPETVLRLKVMLKQAPPAVAAWIDPQVSETGEGSFAMVQVIVIGAKR